MNKSQQHPIDRKVMFLGGSFLVGLTAALSILGIWGLIEVHRQYADWLDGNATVLIEDTGTAIFYGSPPLLLALFLFGLYGIFIGVAGRRCEMFDQHILKPLNVLMLLGLLSLFAGHHLGNSLWANSFEAKGYTRCQEDFVLTGKWATSVWAKTPRICLDVNLRNKLRDPAFPVFDINDHYHAASENHLLSSD